MSAKPVWEGDVVTLYTITAADEPAVPAEELCLAAGQGVEGDYYYVQPGGERVDEEHPYEVTLIESEAIEGVETESKVKIDVRLLGRNIVTRGFSLSHLVGREFQVGEVRLRGVALYEPGVGLMDLAGHKIAVGLMHRGGLGAQILSGGVIRAGDRIHE